VTVRNSENTPRDTVRGLRASPSALVEARFKFPVNEREEIY